MTNTTYSNQDYLEAILLHEVNGSTKSVDVAKELNVSKPAVSLATKELIAKGLITKESYGDIYLTDRGREVATATLKKHNILKNFLLGIGVSQDTALDECCKIEHIISDETTLCLIKFAKEHGLEL